MTLLIAWLLIYGLDLPWPLYLVGLAVWVARTIWNMRGEDDIRRRLDALKLNP